MSAAKRINTQVGSGGTRNTLDVPQVSPSKYASSATSKSHIRTEIQKEARCGVEETQQTSVISAPVVPTQADTCPVIPDQIVKECVLSVNGKTGNIVLRTSDIEEYKNLYFTVERARDAARSSLFALDPINYDPVNGTFSLIQTHITALGVVSIGTWSADPIAVAFGGTGVESWTKGGLLVGTGPNSTTVMPPGAEGTVLMSDPNSPPGVRWVPYVPGSSVGNALILNGAVSNDMPVELKISGSSQVVLSSNTTYVCRVYGTARSIINPNYTSFYEDVFGIIRGDSVTDIHINGMDSAYEFIISNIYAYNPNWVLSAKADTTTGNISFFFRQQQGGTEVIDITLQVVLTTSNGDVIGSTPVTKVVSSFNGRSGDVVFQASDIFTPSSPGIVPAPGLVNGSFLRDDGTWSAISGVWSYNIPDKDVFLSDNEIRVGIRTSSPIEALDVRGNINVDGVATFGCSRNVSGFSINRNVFGEIDSVQYANGRTVVFTRDDSGRIIQFSDGKYRWDIIRSDDEVVAINISFV